MEETWGLKEYSARIINPAFKYVWKSRENTIIDFKNYDDYWKSRRKKLLGNRDAVTAKFGDAAQLSFAEHNIIPFDLSPYAAINKSKIKQFWTHRLIYPAYRRVFEKWAEWGEYPLCSIGSSYSPRYAVTDVTKPIYNARYSQKKNDIDSWVEANKKRILKMPGLGDVDFDWVPAKLFFYECAMGTAKVGSFSNHSFGLALDVNPRTNALSSKIWDMPRRLVEIFMEEGFYWGGCYSEAQLDAMHFEYKLDEIPAAIPLLFGPFSPKSGESPFKIYADNEYGDGGMFPAGLNNNLHGGIHLRPKQPNTPVVASFPGYVVAARLLSPEMFKTTALPYAFSAGSLGLVVVRHTGFARDDKGVQTGDPLSWYALYLHLPPPQYDLAKNEADGWNKVPWFRRLLLAKYGAGVVLDPESSAFEKNVWLAETAADGKTSIEGYEFGYEQESQLKDPACFRVKSDDGFRLLVPKPASEDLVEALESLQQGALITFHRPFLTVKANEVIGISGSSDALKDVEGLASDIAVSGGVKPGFIHWEWLSPPGTKGLEALPGLLGLTGVDMPIIEESSGKSDNFFEIDELDSMLKKHLPPDDQTTFANALKKERYGAALRDFYKFKASFSSSTKTDLESSNQSDAMPSYAISVQLKDEFKLPPPTSGSYTITFDFIELVEGKEKILTSKLYKVTDTSFSKPILLQVPVATRLLRAKSDSFHIDCEVVDGKKAADDSKIFFKDIASRRWRGVMLKHLNDWTVDGLKLLVAKLKDKKLVSETLDADALKPLAWYNRTADAADPFSENPILGPKDKEVSLFTKEGTDPYLLPASTPLVNMHPVTGVWLTTLLESIGKFKVSSSFDAYQPEESKKIIWWSIIKGGASVGSTAMSLVAVAEGFPDEGTAVFYLVHNGRKLSYEVPFVNGLARKQVQLLTWGSWKLEIAGSTEKSKIDGSRLEITGDEPLLCGPARWVREKKSGCIILRVFFSQGCPQSLETFIHVLVRSALGTMDSAGYSILVLGNKRTTLDYVLDSAGNIDLDKSKKISAYFSKAEIKIAAKKGACNLSPAMLWTLESLKECWMKASPSNNGLSLTSLGANGCSASITFKKDTVAEAFVKAAENLFSAETTITRDKVVVTVQTTLPKISCGEWECIFNPQVAFGNVLENNSSATAIDVGFEFLSPNGIDVAEYDVQESDWNSRSVRLSCAEVLQKYNNEVVKTSGNATQQLKPARFGDIHFVLRPVKKRNEETLMLDIMQLLDGRSDDWRRAKPKLTFEMGASKADTVAKLSGTMLTLSIPFEVEMIDQTSTIKASTDINPSKFDGVDIKIPDKIVNEALSPQLLLDDLRQNRDSISFVVWGKLIDPSYFCKVIVVKDGATGEEGDALTKLVKYAAKGKGIFGKFNNGKCNATLSKRGLKKGDTLSVSVQCVDETGSEQKESLESVIRTSNKTIIIE